MGLFDRASKLKKINFVQMTKDDLKTVTAPPRKIVIEPEKTAASHEVSGFEKEVSISGKNAFKPKASKSNKIEILPTYVSSFDELIGRGGLERGSTVLVSGGSGSGKTTFGLQSIHEGALKGEKGIYISLEEDIDKIKRHMLNNYGWDFFDLERKGLVAFLKFDAIEIARTVEGLILKQKEKLVIELGSLEMPFKPDRIVVDSLSALSIAFENSDSYRKYIRYLFEELEKYNSVNYVLSETDQDPKKYSRAGIEEFLADGVIVLYNIEVENSREQAIEILKLRCSSHKKKLVPFEMTPKGIVIYPEQELFRQE